MTQPTNPGLLDPTPARAGRWLAIETAGLYGSIAAGEVTAADCAVSASEPLPRDARSAQTLAPAIHAMLGRLGWSAGDLATIAVGSGPGSFTGLRVGVVTAKTMAYALRVPILGGDTLVALAEGDHPGPEASGLWAVLDAQRGELFAARFSQVNGCWEPDEPTQRLSREALADYLRPGDKVIGPVAESLQNEASTDCSFVATEPSADAVLRAAWRKWNAGGADNAFALAPEYLRLSAAEEKIESPGS